MNKEQLIEFLKHKMIIKKGFKNEDKKMAFAERFLDEHLSKINPTYYNCIHAYFNRDNIILRLKNIGGGLLISHYDMTKDILFQEIQISEQGNFAFNLCHELGHGVNEYVDKSGVIAFDHKLTESFLLDFPLGGTLYMELLDKAKPIINKILKDYKMMLENEFHFDILTRYLENYDLYEEKDSLYRKLGGKWNMVDPNISKRAEKAVKNGTFYPNLKRYQEIEKILESRNATNLDKKIKASYSRYNILSIYTSSLCESLIPFYDAKKYHLFIHSINYFDDEGLYSEELFADFFAYKLTDDEESLFMLKSLLPETYKKCEEFFEYVFTHYLCSASPEYVEFEK